MSIFGWGSSQPERTAQQLPDSTIVGGMVDFVSYVLRGTTAKGKAATAYGGKCAYAVNSAYRRLGDKLKMPELTEIKGDAGPRLINQYKKKGQFREINAAAPSVVGDLAYTEARDPKTGEMRYHVATYMMDKQGRGVWVSDAVQQNANPYGGAGTTHFYRNPKIANFGLTYMQERRGFAPDVSDKDYQRTMEAFNGDNPETNAKIRARYAARHGGQAAAPQKQTPPAATKPAAPQRVGGIIGRIFYGEKDDQPAVQEAPAAPAVKAKPGKPAKPANGAKQAAPAKPNYKAMNTAQVAPANKPPKAAAKKAPNGAKPKPKTAKSAKTSKSAVNPATHVQQNAMFMTIG